MTQSNHFIEAQMQVWGQETLQETRNSHVAIVVLRRLKKLLARFLKTGLLLDVGGYRGFQVEGLRAFVHDLSLPALRDARQRVPAAICGDIHNLPYKTRSFDCILLSHVLEHSHQPEQLLKEIARVLKDDGHLIVVVPNAAGLGQLIKLIRHGDVKPAGNPPWEPPEHLHHFTKKNSINFLNDNHWRIVHFEGDILDFPLRDKLKCFKLADWLARYRGGRWAESLVFVCCKASFD